MAWAVFAIAAWLMLLAGCNWYAEAIKADRK